MNELEITKKDESEIDLGQMIRTVLDKAWLVVTISVVCAVLTFCVTLFCIAPKYESTAMFYVNNSALSLGNTSLSISSGDLTTSRNLVDSYLVILNTWETLRSVSDYAGIAITPEDLSELITAQAVNETEIFAVTVTSTDPVKAERLANAIAYILPKRIDTIIDGTSAKIVSSALLPVKPSSPSFVMNTILGFLIGFVLTVGGVVMQEIFDITIRKEEDVLRITKLPILAAVPDMLHPTKGGYYNKSSNGKKRKKGTPKNLREEDMVGDDIPFAAAEAYKLLRTKVQYSFSDDKNCHIIGVSSALAGEGKSTTSVNLACVLAQLNKKVLLIDCDLRRPSVAAKMKISNEVGLSGFLTRQCEIDQIVMEYKMKHGVSFAVIPAGKIPPNPTELLNSSRMGRFLERFGRNFDYVILDLPPVEEVSDALVAAKLADGVLLAVRQDYCNRVALEDTIQQFNFVNGRILGLLMTCATEHGKGYGKSYYKRYYNRYGSYSKYAHAYEKSHMEQRSQNKT